MQRRRDFSSYADFSAAKRFVSEPVWYRLRTKEWEFFVSNEIEAFSVLSRHDVDDVTLMTVQ
ncbi:MAG: hypothetical protein Q8Q62_03545 [Mesorhizobium sp.]|nr:hypothetical protein [Mesorhizobium sp.]